MRDILGLTPDEVTSAGMVSVEGAIDEPNVSCWGESTTLLRRAGADDTLWLRVAIHRGF
jgi:hypothetical protein